MRRWPEPRRWGRRVDREYSLRASERCVLPVPAEIGRPCRCLAKRWYQIPGSVPEPGAFADPEEFELSAATEDLFTPIHKGLRSMVYDLSGRLQTNDFADVDATEALITDLETDFAIARSAGCVVCVLGHHAADEESVIFPKVGTRGGGLVQQLIDEHHELTRREIALGKAGHEILALGSSDQRVAAGIRLNQDANELFAAYLAHMNREDTELVPLMCQHFTDEQMVAMRSAIIGQMPRDRLLFILGWMLPSLNASELAGLLGSIRQGAPPPFFQAVSDLCAAKVDPARWKEVQVRLGM